MSVFFAVAVAPCLPQHKRKRRGQHSKSGQPGIKKDTHCNMLTQQVPVNALP